jgi:co-chaperonin GroES (HSP10)
MANESLKEIRPVDKYILVRPQEEESRETENGLIIPGSVDQERKAQGTVLGIGAGVTDSSIRIGGEIIYGVYAGETIKRREDGKEVEYKLIHIDDVVAVLV